MHEEKNPVAANTSSLASGLAPALNKSIISNSTGSNKPERLMKCERVQTEDEENQKTAVRLTKTAHLKLQKAHLQRN